MEKMIQLPKGIFTLSIDTELAWGTRGRASLRPDYERTRVVIDRLLGLCEKYHIAATWAVVGHLFLDHCEPVNGVKHPEIMSPRSDWFSVDPATDVQTDPIWYGKDIVEKIRSCKVPQEIGCHTFSHVRADDPGCSEACFESELRACQSIAVLQALPKLTSFVYPENVVRHVPLLSRNGFTAYRGPDNTWYRHAPGLLKRVAHVVDEYALIPARTVMPKFEDGIWNIPGSYYYPHRHGWGKGLPVMARVRKVVKGIDEAMQQKRVFHLWFHPFNIASDPNGLIGGLEMIFKVVDAARKSQDLEQLTMRQIVDICQPRL
ncbi:polysaccharide deacetylase family protein [Patescibacteria group bacterium]|nr:polysaccharide deacetylase family protein [Patescibacteria group bacterium]